MESVTNQKKISFYPWTLLHNGVEELMHTRGFIVSYWMVPGLELAEVVFWGAKTFILFFLFED